MPQRFSARGIQGQYVAVRVAGENQSRVGGQHAGARAAWAEIVRPTIFTGLIIDRFENAFAPQAVIGAGPSIGSVRGLVEVDAIGVARANNEQPALRIEARR